MSPYDELKSHLDELKRERRPKPPAIACSLQHAELLVAEAMKRSPNHVKLKPGKISVFGVRIIPMSASDLALQKKRYKEEHPIEIPERRLILPEHLYAEDH